MAEFSRPSSGFRFKFAGLKTNCAPDACPPTKYPLAQNCRATNDDEIRCRPGMSLLFNTASGFAISNIASYSQGQGIVLYLASSDGNVYKDDSATPVATGFNATAIQAMLPYRPNQSVAPWMFVGDGNQYLKISFPNASNAVTVAKVGIAEPQTPPGAALALPSFQYFNWITGGTYTAAGTASGLATGNRTTD